jgi:hypothetical protein
MKRPGAGKLRFGRLKPSLEKHLSRRHRKPRSLRSPQPRNPRPQRPQPPLKANLSPLRRSRPRRPPPSLRRRGRGSGCPTASPRRARRVQRPKAGPIRPRPAVTKVRGPKRGPAPAATAPAGSTGPVKAQALINPVVRALKAIALTAIGPVRPPLAAAMPIVVPRAPRAIVPAAVTQIVVRGRRAIGTMTAARGRTAAPSAILRSRPAPRALGRQAVVSAPQTPRPPHPRSPRRPGLRPQGLANGHVLARTTIAAAADPPPAMAKRSPALAANRSVAKAA